MVRNMQTIRFANQVLNRCGTRRHCGRGNQCSMEDVGVETRGDYYDASGALKDMARTICSRF